MHNVDVYRYLEFGPADTAAASAATSCKNVLWPARFVLAQVYQAQVQHLDHNSIGHYYVGCKYIVMARCNT